MSDDAELILDLYRKADSLSDIAKTLELPPAHISYAIYKLQASAKYTEFSVPKRSGGVRTIRAPHKALKTIQKRLARDLAAIEAHLESKRLEKSDCILAHGFKKTLSIVTNSENHRRRRYVLNIDLKDFFPSINFGRVYGYFLKNKSFELKPKVAAVLAQIACHENQLPQGSPCSPVISNLIAGSLDIRLNELARKYNCTYTRYADDITFSTSERLFPAALARRNSQGVNLWEAGPKLLKIIERSGFELNPAKTRMQLDYSRQDVTGLIVNQKVNISSDYYETVAAMCHHLFMDGECFITAGEVKKPFPRHKLRGRLAFIYQIRGKGPKTVQKEEGGEVKSQTLWSSFKLFERFLNYVDLYGAKRPVILCEGVTDNIYIKAAIQASPASYPVLATPAGKLKVKQFKYTKSSAAVQQLSGGSGELLKLVNTYSTRTKKFKHPAANPLILIADSDDANKKLFKVVEGRTGFKIGTQPWFHLGSNLYVVPIPKVEGVDTPIEMLFEKTLLDKIYDGKKFDQTNSEKDGSKFYGKKVFATKVVATEKAAVNFAGFIPLLDAIAGAIADYKFKIGAPPFPVASTIPVSLAAS